MTVRQALHKLVDSLPERELPTATRVLEALSLPGAGRPADEVAGSLAAAPFDDEPDDDDFDGGLSTARQEASEGQLVPHEEMKREFGLP